MPEITCTGAIGPSDPVAIVTLVEEGPGIGPTVLRDYADISHPRTVCRGVHSWRILNARHLWTIGGCADGLCRVAIVDLPSARYHWYAFPTGDGGGVANAIAPDQRAIAWTHWTEAGARTLHVADSSGDHTIATFPHTSERCGSPFDSDGAAYAASGRYLYVLDQSLPGWNTLVVVEGHELVFSLEPPADGWPDREWPMMAVWSPVADALYYRLGSLVFRWTPDKGAERVLRGVEWLYPTFTPDGRHLAYAVVNANGGHDLYLAKMPDLAGAERIGHNRGTPFFLNDRQLWYVAETPGGCGGTESRRPLVYDIRSNSEAPSIIDFVDGTWPATSSNL